MADYQAMYTVLFQNVTAAIEELQNAQRQTEEMYLSAEPTNVTILENDKTE